MNSCRPWRPSKASATAVWFKPSPSKPRRSASQACLPEAVASARAAAGKAERTKSMLLYYLLSRNLQKIEGQQFTLRTQKNS
jgi:hypothetical protein